MLRLELPGDCSLLFVVSVLLRGRHFRAKIPPILKKYNSEAAHRFMWRYPGMLLVLSVFFGGHLRTASPFFCSRSGRKSTRSRQATWHWEHHRAHRLHGMMAQPSGAFHMIIMRGFSSSLIPYRQVKRVYCPC